MIRGSLAGVVLFAVACASAPTPPPPAAVSAETLVDHSGDSPETAVAVPKDAPNDGIDWMNNWIYDHHGRFRRKSWAIANKQGRHYEVIVFELPDHSEHTVYFDITESWETWRPPAPPPPPH
jgi:hypothetical protein